MLHVLLLPGCCLGVEEIEGLEPAHAVANQHRWFASCVNSLLDELLERDACSTEAMMST